MRTMQVSRKESARITLHGNAEFEASDVMLAGDCEFDVPAGQRMRVVAGQGGKPRVSQGLKFVDVSSVPVEAHHVLAVYGVTDPCALCTSAWQPV
jgi:hypothetical protein